MSLLGMPKWLKGGRGQGCVCVCRGKGVCVREREKRELMLQSEREKDRNSGREQRIKAIKRNRPPLIWNTFVFWGFSVKDSYLQQWTFPSEPSGAFFPVCDVPERHTPHHGRALEVKH